jgi:amino acid adenylation domain-containing protein
MTSPEATAHSIAIVGLAGKFPGARDAAEFWENLRAGRSTITQLSDEQLAASGYDPAAVRALPGYVAARGLIDRPEWFDRAFFGIAPKEAEAMDPQYRVFLETAWAALEDAGCDPARYPGLVGVFGGMSNATYYPFFVRQRRDILEAVGAAGAVIGNEKDFLATRLAHKLNLRGPALNIQTACSTSLVAICVACQNLLDHQCDVALAGGVSITFPHERGYFAEEGGMTSTDGVCSPFDVRANGTVFGNGAGLVVLKRLADALADGDQVYAVIRGQAVNNDGAKKVSFAAPGVDGHVEVIALAQAVAGVTPDTISYVEAHGTATPLGDPIEVAGLTQVFRESTDAKQTCPLGSVKGNIGHLDAASGVASLIKTALALRHGVIPPSVNCTTPNPALHLEDSPFFINTELRPWERGEQPRRASVSSFGVGGTNAHVILEEAPVLASTPAGDAPQLLVLSAKTATALEQRAEDLAAHLERDSSQPLADVAFTLQTGRQTFAHRRVVVARTHADAVAALRAPAKLQRVDDRHDTPLAFLFPGQGSQYPGMGAHLYAGEPFFREALSQCAALLRPELGLDLCDLLFSRSTEADAQLRETRFTQPAIFAVSYALACTWRACGLQPAALLGHSVGEFVAGAIAGVFSWEDAARLVALRARLTQELPRGAMLAARLSEEEAEEFLADPRLAIAAVNSPKLCVLSGPLEAIEALEATFAERTITARRLATSHAFHSPMVEPVVEPLLEALRAITLHAPQIPIVSSATGEWLTDAQATDPEYWASHLRATVRFSDAAARLLGERDFALLETGPGQTLSQLVRQNSARTPRHEVAHSIAEETDDEESLVTALGRLWLAGVPIDWRTAHAGSERRRVSLPTYPFERQRYFADLPAGVSTPITTAATDGDAPPEADAIQGLLRAAAPAPAIEASLAATADPVEESSLAQLKKLLADLSGLDLSVAPGTTSLLDLGFDSLFLSQVAITVTRRFGVKITLRQLLGDLGTLDALAAVLPPSEGCAPARPTPSAPAPAPLTAHGPFKPLQRDANIALTAQQQGWLDDFIARYTARTAASKQHTQEHRAHFADPRAIAGFKQLWKEMVYPIVADRSAGSRLWDIDGNEWLDVTMSYGAAMLGHQPPFVVEALRVQLDRGLEIGPTSPLAGEVAALLCELTGLERATFCNTGSEAVTGALRAARTVTGRTKVVYFRDSYHGIDNEVLGRRAGDSIQPIAPGIPNAAVADTIILDYDDLRSLETIAALAGDIAAVLVEPVQSRHPALQPREFLHELRALTQRHGIALIFDEIISGFRCHLGGAQAFFGVRADLATYGKVIGGGLPIGALAGRAEFMDAFDGGAWNYGDDSFPGAAVTFFAGTFVRHPLALAAARAVLTHLKESGPTLQQTLAARASGMIDRIAGSLAGSPFSAQRFASSWLIQTAPEFKYAGLLFAALRLRGIHIWENRPCFVSTAHTDADLDRVADAFAESVAELEDAGFFSRSKAASASAGDAFPVTEAQQELWLVCQQGPAASSACNETWTLGLEGALDIAALRSAAQTIVDRHESFRSTFAKSGETIAVAPTLKIEIPLHDLSDDPQRGTRFDALRAAESARVFDLERGPLLVLQLVRLAPESHALIFNAHHLICDGWSCDIFLNELSTIYSAQGEGRPHGLPAPMTMREYERFAAALRETPEFAADAAFWLEKYRTVPAALTLPGDRPHPKWRSFRGASEIVLLPAEFAQAVSRFGAQRGATFFSVLLAGYKALLFRLSGQGDFAVGVPSAGQNLVEGGPLVGHCVNTLPLRSQVHAEQSFAELVKDVQETVLDAFEHQRVTFGWLLQQLSFSREPGRVPIMPVTFNVDPPLSHIRFAGLRHRLIASPRSAYQFDLGINCDNTPDGLRVLCNYNTDLFDAATVRGWIGQYRALIEAGIADPARSLSGLSMASGPKPKIELWPSAATSTPDGDPLYDDVAYNAMSHDFSRHEFYRRAFRQTVKDKVVLDIGTGRDALFARMCIEEGARKVFAIELLERPARLAAETVERLGLSSTITVIQGRSQEIELPEQVDVCVSETRGGETILDDARRFLRPGGKIIPARCLTIAAAVSLPEEFLEDPRFNEIGASYARQAWNLVGYKHDLRLCIAGTSREMLCSTEEVFEDVHFGAPPVETEERTLNFAITREAHIDGLLLWNRWEAIPGEVLDAMENQDSWLPIYLPIFSPPIAVRTGDWIEATLHSTPTDNHLFRDFRIAGQVVRGDGTVMPFDFDAGYYSPVYRHTPFYARLFRDDTIPVALSDVVLPPQSASHESRGAAANLSPAPAVSEAERWLAWSHGPATACPLNLTIPQIFAQWVKQQPAAVAVVEGEKRYSYAEIDRWSNAVAHGLRALPPGGLVGVPGVRSAAFVATVLGVLKAGGAYVPLSPEETPQRLAERRAACAVVFEELPPFAQSTTTRPVRGTSDSPAYVLFTSGSTGVPKGVIIPQRGILRLVCAADYIEIHPEDVFAFHANLAFDPSTFELWGPLLNGASLAVTDTETILSADALAAHLEAHGINVMQLTSALFNRLAHENPRLFAPLRYLQFGGEAADAASVHRVLAEGAPGCLVNCYGPTEATTTAVCHRIEQVDGDTIPIGRPIAHTQAIILDEALQPAAEGELYLGGAGLALGYLDAPELTAERFLETEFGRLYKTGDLARWRPDGSLDFLGRADRQIKIRGFRVEPAEVEAALQRHPRVRQSVVVARPAAEGENQLAGYFVGDASAEELRDFLRGELPSHLIPGDLVPLDTFPLTANGKLDLDALPAPAAFALPDDAPATRLEGELAELWEEVLGRNHLSAQDDFFLVGGHSLLAIRLIGRMRERFGVDVPVQRLFETPTIRGLAEFVSTHLPAAASFESIVMIQRGEEGQRPLFIVPGGWGGEVEFLVYAQLARHLDAKLPVFGLRVRGSNAEALPDKTVEEFAADFVADLCAFQPEGPYLLGGECVGGVIAYEMARQLIEAGKEVAVLLLLGTEWPNRQSLDEFVAYERQRQRRQFWRARLLQPAKGHWQKLGQLTLREKWRYVWTRLRRGALPSLPATATLEREVLTEYPRRLMAHEPKPHAAKVTLVLDEELHRRFGTVGWETRHPGELEVHLVPGDHVSYIREHAPAAAATLREILERAQLPISC